jgi:hypothetical protein
MSNTTTAPTGVVSSTELGADSIVWVRHNGKPHTSGVAHFGGECPPGWVSGARPFFSAEYLAAAVAAERERCISAIRAAHDDGNAAGIERDVYIWNKAVAHCLHRLLGPNTTNDRPTGSVD